jgi:hypothetical protein
LYLEAIVWQAVLSCCNCNQDDFHNHMILYSRQDLWIINKDIEVLKGPHFPYSWNKEATNVKVIYLSLVSWLWKWDHLAVFVCHLSVYPLLIPDGWNNGALCVHMCILLMLLGSGLVNNCMNHLLHGPSNITWK